MSDSNITKMSPNQLASLQNWIQFFANIHQAHIVELDIMLLLIGADDGAYLTLIHTAGGKNVEYRLNTESKRKPLAALIHWLDNFGYQIESLIELIKQLEYTSYEDMQVARYRGMEIWKKESI
ncbi:hypothetical protein [Aliikangiella maris]|uniref:Uncharacterized protein n=2 Tax=Aliikangiella maris TaxID=3162458 RepID=A0ABV3MNU3_9GAMM